MRETADRKARAVAEERSLLAEALDYEATLRAVARLAVAELADWCVVYAVEPDGSIRRLEVTHADPAKKALADELAAHLIDGDLPEGVPRVIRSGQPALVPEVDHDHLEALGLGNRQLRIVKELGTASYMILPLLAHGRAIGAISFISGGARRYGPGDLDFARDLAARAALAMDNARLYEEAQTASRAKSQFLAVMSHELRTPLTAIIACADLLESEITGPLADGQREQVGHIVSSALHLLHLIEEILGFSRIESGREAPRYESVDLARLVRETAKPLEPVAAEKRLRFEVDVPDESLEAVTDPARVRQILLNLLANALKFTDDGEVRVRLRRRGEVAELAVSDDGIGIAPDDHERIFDPFWQVDLSDRRRAGGAGLGLSVSRELVGLLGGEIRVDSEAGRGTTFTVHLPLAGPARQTGASAGPFPQPAGPPGTR